MKRRQLLGALAASALLPGAARAQAMAQAALGPMNLLVAGPNGGATSRWGNAFALAIADHFPGSPNIVAEPVGGLDGVTGANRLDALMVPDGRSAAILPGAALIAFLTGDSRVHFNPTQWTPLLAGFNSGVLMLRAPKGSVPTLETLQQRSPLRLGAAQTQSDDLAALLALARLGVATVPVFGLHSNDEKTRAFIAGTVDAVFICGEGVPEDITPLIASGAVPAFCIGAPGPGGSVGPDPLFPGLALPSTLGPTVSPLLASAYEAAAAAARLDFLMVLPRLTDPGAVSIWRSAAIEAAGSEAVAAAAQASSISLQPATVLANALTALAIVPAEQPQLLAFLAKNYGWQPG
ncbi:hypothetical protein [Acidocella sp. MX-AZ02]|uniref:hypothetical protein n=2 Tax=unclassified Acidocella TaxID=2648610 RepID=UPI00028D53BF|nr:hypothetical protein [Acidocella sp. MX-AZ02]EKM98705.1 hypothetical protein MXAZACID_14148 [Acidocella sp. MX-AZ02]